MVATKQRRWWSCAVGCAGGRLSSPDFTSLLVCPVDCRDATHHPTVRCVHAPLPPCTRREALPQMFFFSILPARRFPSVLLAMGSCLSVCLSQVSVLSERLKEPSRFGHMTALSSTYPTLCYKTRYRPAAAETICPLPMAVLSKNRSPHISGGRRRLSCRQPACLWPRQLRHGTERRTDRAIPKCPP